jgi:hypothetical protein
MTYEHARSNYLMHVGHGEYCCNARSVGHYVTIHDLCPEGQRLLKAIEESIDEAT